MSSDSADVLSSGQTQTESSTSHEALTISAKDLAAFWNKKAPGNKCLFCKSGDYALGLSPSGDGTAVLVATPLPNMKHLGMWFYVATCVNCGHVVLFNAQKIVREISKDQ